MRFWQRQLMFGIGPAWMCWAFSLAASAAEPTVVEKLCQGYERIESLSGDIRKEVRTEKSSVEWLTRVYYRKPNQVHVENIAPMKRRIVSDGATLYYYQEGAPKGFSRPIQSLDADWLRTVNNIPATPMEHLTRFRNAPETVLESTPELPVRRGYKTEKVYVVLGCDADGRLARLEFFRADDMKDKVAVYEYSQFTKVSDDCWIPCLQKGVMLEPAMAAQETRRIGNLIVNQPIAAGLFDAKSFFKGVEFTADFDSTF
ncbi:MAG: hypothetical protein HY343_06705 [Lentisphaerae bacterium]|nr:hypothetical protein [Lentisphaerota bacterium]